MEKKTKSRGLGRGLSALMADVTPEDDTGTAGSRRADMVVPIERVHPNPDQPRRSFTPEQLEELAGSIKKKGVIQPLIVRPRPGDEGAFEIVAGERRWRAAQMAQLHEIPVIVREYDDTEVLEVAIIENIQRADLNPVEEAAGYRQLMEKFGHTQEKLSDVLGKSRSYIANLVRLLSLPDEVQGYLRDGSLSTGHARALITSDDAVALARDVIKKGLSVRQTEKLAKSGVGGHAKGRGKTPSARTSEKDADTKALEGDLSASLGMKVEINHDSGQESGRITVSYDTLEQLDDLCMRLSR
ncbi:ParB/RepB/Spo0J family partition protein [Lutimaribacter sp. EGI FJ00015]|uniref:ParB/RepB/Spo0J family partition protein n=1 Tax=Lutimaribacter degradans TaxID=2945989 RepID=A0ACC5ZUW0_9RHOB|nr:ParB/RepB/Spo0J family partition protein [Lutimaribacter sp. EGI FJ00013]MCM2561970.1 ParB/RepB/Spo0J family partition protein [Lutimaribacter sp. EGI FJ00013]MCO0612998.1 ParB/RepB/Spo0J family partition protein [Lutimaribacter sp. EGI FJ00015]MCO0635802.1 ParB/RepB/Spo0J family partition protein [Lutimaribacter sp. EGI FJ00014]